MESLKSSSSQYGNINENLSYQGGNNQKSNKLQQIPGVVSSESFLRMNQIDEENNKLKKKMKTSSKKKGKKTADDDDDANNGIELEAKFVVKGFELPEGARESDDEDKKKQNRLKDVNDPHRALDINLDEYV